jgi:hypothetical protein
MLLRIRFCVARFLGQRSNHSRVNAAYAEWHSTATLCPLPAVDGSAPDASPMVERPAAKRSNAAADGRALRRPVGLHVRDACYVVTAPVAALDTSFAYFANAPPV